MLDIGLIHRREYELDVGRTGGGSRAGKAPAGKGGSSPRTRAEREVSAVPVIIAQAPGRLHFLGEHGDPNGGLYLSAAIDRWIKIAVSPRKDGSLRFYAVDLCERKRTTMINLKFKREDRWANYIKIAIYVFAEMGFAVKGLNFTLAGDIPQQIGLASSTAIEVASAVALKNLFHVKISELDLARKLFDVHALFYGKNPELADYLVGLCARKDQLLLIDEYEFTITKIKSPFSRCKFILMDSRVPRFGVETELMNRRENLKDGLEILSQGRQGAVFREFADADLIDSMGNLPEVIRRRSLHVVQEIRRVRDAADCLQRGDLAGFTRLVFHSHESLRDLYEVSCPEIDWMVKRAQETVGVLGARMAGQGFGGCTYSIIKNEAIGEYRERIDDYERIFGFHPAIFEVKLASGSHVVNEK